METQAPQPPASAVPQIYGLAIHGGAGAPARHEATPESDRQHHAKLAEALAAGYTVLAANGTATDAVMAAIIVLEDAGLFDAGKGSVFNAAGICELDAAIMDGRTLAAGAATGLQHVKNPVLLARAVMDQSRHVLLMGAGAEAFASVHGLEIVPNTYFHTERRRKQWEKLKEQRGKTGHAASFSPDQPEVLGTVGCVALDQHGNLAAGTSTGGTADKLAGRIGDTPIIGAGTYANNATCAVSGTGIGEYYIRTVFAHTISALMEYRGLSLAEASAATMKQMADLGGSGGCIAIDRAGNVVMPFNTPAMYRAFKLSNGRTAIELYGPAAAPE